MTDDDALVPMDMPITSLTLARDPEAILEEAHRAAKALKHVIDSKDEKKKVRFGGEVYLELEDWLTVGRFYGIVPRTPESGTKYVEYGGAKGWEAYAEAIHVETGRVVSSAMAMCLDDEPKWRTRGKYEFHYMRRSGGSSLEDPGYKEIIWEEVSGKRRPKKSRVYVGEEPVPSFQLRSMAQTRAAGKALRNALSWVVVLAGYKPTPAEEMPVVIPAAAAVVTYVEAPGRAVEEEVEVGLDGEGPPTGPDAVARREWLRIEYMRLLDVLKFKSEQRVAIFKQYCPTATGSQDAPLAGLGAMHAELVGLAKAQGLAFDESGALL